jgi:phosphoglycerate dehydrogenase-like enzyme
VLTSHTGDAPKILLVTSTNFTPELTAKLEKAAGDAEIVTVADDLEAIRAAVPGANALVFCPRWAFDDELLRQAGNSLRWVHVGGAGCEGFFLPNFVASDITFTNGRIIQGPEVADHALALLLSITRNLHLILRNQTEAPMPRPQELRGKTAVVVGLGGIGMLIAERAAAFGMRVIGVNPDYAPMLSIIDQVVPPERLNEILPQADVVFVAAPHTPATENMFGKSAFLAMKSSAILIAVSRGKLINFNALTEALENSEFAAAGLDVTDPEPLPNGHPLRMMNNVVITPHIAGLSEYNRDRSFELACANVDRFVQGLPLYNVVDKKLGY